MRQREGVRRGWSARNPKREKHERWNAKYACVDGVEISVPCATFKCYDAEDRNYQLCWVAHGPPRVAPRSGILYGVQGQ